MISATFLETEIFLIISDFLHICRRLLFDLVPFLICSKNMLKREGETLQVVSMEGLVWIVVGALAATVILGKRVFILHFSQSALCETRLSS